MNMWQKGLFIIFVCFYASLGSSVSSSTCNAAGRWAEFQTRRVAPVMKDIKLTVASMTSVLSDTSRNLEQVRKACTIAKKADARLVFLPECMLSGHGAHPKMIQNAEPGISRRSLQRTHISQGSLGISPAMSATLSRLLGCKNWLGITPSTTGKLQAAKPYELLERC